LEGLTEDEIYARSGSLRDGYSSPEDQAVELMEEAIEPYEKEVFRYLELGMFQEAKIYCMGVLKGIYRYDQESKSNSKGWFVDIPEECFGNLLEKWKKRIMGPPDLKELNDFLKTECSRWFSWALKL